MITDWYRLARFVGYWRIQAVSLELPVQNVLDMLPNGATLGQPGAERPKQAYESCQPREGYHPVRLYFNWVHANMAWPTIIPAITYLEVVVGIPSTYLTARPYSGAYVGPFYYMPQVWTSTTPGGVWALGGRPLWGIPRNLGRFETNAPPPGVPPWQGGPTDAGCGAFALRLSEPFGNLMLSDNVEHVGSPILGLEWATREPYSPVDSPGGYALTRVQQDIMNQPLLMRMPMGIGPWWVGANFKMTWPSAWVRSVEARVHVFQTFVAGLPLGTYRLPPLADARVVGSYQLFCPFELSAPSSSDAVGWTYPAATLLGPPGTGGVPSYVPTGV